MIGKVKTGKSFAGCIRYNLEREEATILHAEGIRTGCIQHIINDFNMQRKMNPELGQAVGHIVLSWSVQDKEKLSPDAVAQHTKEYLQKMKIADTQYLVVQHHDREHPHIHIVYNRVNNEGKTISDKYQRERNAEVCKQLTLKHGYHIAKGKTEVNRLRLTGADKIKYQLYDAIKQTSIQARNWKELENLLKRQGIELHYKYKVGTNEVQGISFSKDGLKLKGSEIDRSLSYGKLNQQLEQNQQNQQKVNQQKQNLPGFEQVEIEVTAEPLLDKLLNASGYEEAVDFHFFKRKKTKHTISQGRTL